MSDHVVLEPSKVVTNPSIPRRCLHAVCTAVLLVASIALLFSGVEKSLDLAQFRTTLASHNTFDAEASWYVAPAVAATEFLIAITSLWLLCVTRRCRHASNLLAGLAIAFAAYAGWLVLFPPPAPASCGCAGSRALINPNEWWTIAWRNLAIAVSLLLSGFFAYSPKSK